MPTGSWNRAGALPPRRCKWCGAEFQPKQDKQEFCRPAHRTYERGRKRAVKLATKALEEGKSFRQVMEEWAGKQIPDKR